MKKTLSIFPLFLIIYFHSFSQELLKHGQFSVAFETGIPINSAADVYWLAVGGSIKYEKPINTDISINISAGYTDFNFTKAVKADIRALGGNGSSENFIPLKIGVKHFFNPNDPAFFAEMQFGGAVSTEKNGGTAFIFAPGVGYEFESGFEAGLRYEGWLKSNGIDQIGIRLGYNF